MIGGTKFKSKSRQTLAQARYLGGWEGDITRFFGKAKYTNTKTDKIQIKINSEFCGRKVLRLGDITTMLSGETGKITLTKPTDTKSDKINIARGTTDPWY